MNKKAGERRNNKGRIYLSIPKMEIIYYLWIFKVYPSDVLSAHVLSEVKNDIHLRIMCETINENTKVRIKPLFLNIMSNNDMIKFFYMWIESKTNKIKLCYYLKDEMMKQKRILGVSEA